MENTTFEQKLVIAIENIKDNPSESNSKILKKLFNKGFSSNQANIFEMFSSDRLTLEQQKILFDSIGVKQKCQLYNTISVDSRKKFYYSLSEGDAKKFIKTIRKQAVADAKILERDLLKMGFGTNDWSIEQIKDIYELNNDGTFAGKAGTPQERDAFGNYKYSVSIAGKKTKNPGKVTVNKKAYEGHHMLNVHDYPQFAGDGKVIQFLDRIQHIKGAHAGKSSHETLAYYDGSNYLGVKYIEPHIGKNGEFFEGKFVADGKVYQFDSNLKKFTELKPGSKEYIKKYGDASFEGVRGTILPLRHKLDFLPSIDEMEHLFKSEDDIYLRIGIAEYRKLRIDIDVSHINNNSEMINHLKSVGEDSSQLSKATIFFNNEGIIDEVIVNYNDPNKEMQLFSGSNPSSERYSATADEYKKMCALPSDGTKSSVNFRYKCAQYDDLTIIEKLKLKKADAIFAEKNLYVSLRNLNDASRKNVINNMLQIADNPKLADKAVFYFDKKGEIIDLEFSGKIASKSECCFASKFSVIRNLPSDYEIMLDNFGFGEKKLSNLEKHKIRTGIGTYECLSKTKIKNLFHLSGLTDEINGKIMGNHLLDFANDADSLDFVGLYFDENGKLLAIETQNNPFDGEYAFSMSAKELKRILSNDDIDIIRDREAFVEAIAEVKEKDEDDIVGVNVYQPKDKVLLENGAADYNTICGMGKSIDTSTYECLNRIGVTSKNESDKEIADIVISNSDKIKSQLGTEIGMGTVLEIRDNAYFIDEVGIREIPDFSIDKGADHSLKAEYSADPKSAIHQLTLRLDEKTTPKTEQIMMLLDIRTTGLEKNNDEEFFRTARIKAKEVEKIVPKEPAAIIVNTKVDALQQYVGKPMPLSEANKIIGDVKSAYNLACDEGKKGSLPIDIDVFSKSSNNVISKVGVRMELNEGFSNVSEKMHSVLNDVSEKVANSVQKKVLCDISKSFTPKAHISLKQPSL